MIRHLNKFYLQEGQNQSEDNAVTAKEAVSSHLHQLEEGGGFVVGDLDSLHVLSVQA